MRMCLYSCEDADLSLGCFCSGVDEPGVKGLKLSSGLFSLPYDIRI